MGFRVLGRRGLACLIASLLISAGVSVVPSRAQSDPDDPGYEFQWGFSQIGAQDAWAIGKGRGATVAVLSTGVDLTHEDLDGQLVSGGRDVTNDDGVPQDDNGQGTHMAGIIAAATGNGKGVAGVAHQAKILPIKVLDDEDEGFENHVLEGIRYAIEKKVQVLVLDLDADVILTDGGFDLEEAITAAWDAGIIPVVSGDHSFVRSRQFGDAPALVVGGVTREGNASSDNVGVGFAQWGISAPGGAGNGDEHDIFSTYFAHSRLGREYGRYVYEAGNAQAAAHVAGAAAILRGLGQTPTQTVERLMSSATDAGVTGRDRVYGVGLLHAGKSVRGIPAQQAAGASGAGTGSPTTVAPTGSGSGDGGSVAGATSDRPSQPGRTAPGAQQGSPDAPGAGIGTPAGAAPEGNPAAADDATGEAGDVVGGLAARPGPADMPGRTPLLPLIAFLLIVGSGTITWALRRRTLESATPINAPTN